MPYPNCLEVNQDHPFYDQLERLVKFHNGLIVPGKRQMVRDSSDPVIGEVNRLVIIFHLGKLRLKRLLEASILLADSENSYGLAQSVRALMENAGWLGHALHVTRNWPPVTEVPSLERLITGSKLESLNENPGEQSINVLTCLPNAERVLADLLLDEVSLELDDFYKVQSEYVHPNFDSHFSEAECDNQASQLIYSEEQREKTLSKLIAHLTLAIFANEQLMKAGESKIRELTKS